MNKFLLFLGVLSLLSACTKSDSDNSGSGNPANLSTISIADATIIYKRTSSSRAGSSNDEGYWKIDQQGNESKIVMYDQEGNPTDLEINKIEKINDNLLLVETVYYLRFIADLRTEKLYQGPDILQSPIKEGADGMLYFIGASSNNMLYKLDPQNFTIEQALSDGQTCNYFLINKNGIIYYDNKFRLPSGRIYPNVNSHVFLLNGEFYSLDSNQQFEIYKWNLTSDNNIEKTKISSLLDIESFESNMQPEKIVYNAKRNASIIYIPTYLEDVPGHEGAALFEFNGSQISFIKSYGQDPNEFNQLLSLWLNMTETESLYNNYMYFSGAEILTFDIETYSITSVPYTFPDGYEIYETTLDEINSRQLFTALRYEDGKVVIGEVSADGQISIINEKESSNKIINLIPLN